MLLPFLVSIILDTVPSLIKYCSSGNSYEFTSDHPFIESVSTLSVVSGSSHTPNVLIGVEYRNCRQTLDAYLLFAIFLGLIKSKSNHRPVTYKLASP